MASGTKPLRPWVQNAVAIGAIATPIMLVAILVFNFIPVGVDSSQQRDIQHALYAVRESQYRACVLNGNTLRNQVRREFVDIKRKSLIPTYEGIAATLPDGAPAKAILEGQVAYLKSRIKTIRTRLPDVHCLAVYPPLKGQTYPQIKPPRSQPEGDHPRTPQGASATVAPTVVEPVAVPTVTPTTPSAPPVSPPPSPPPTHTTGPTGPQGPQGPQGPSGGGNPPPTPPPPQPSLLDPVTQPVCDITGICL